MKSLLCVTCLMVSGLAVAQPASAATPQQALNRVIEDVDLDGTSARRAFEWLSLAAGFNLVADWNRLAEEGHDVDRPVTLQLRDVQARTVLKLLLAETFDDDQVVAQVTADYVRLMSRQQAVDDAVVKIYFIGDLLFDPPSFDNAPEFSLDQISQDTDSGTQSIFEDLDDDAGEQRLSRRERAEQIADLIARSIEPDIWERNGGQGARITYYRNNLVIRAPEYVHRQIGRASAMVATDPLSAAAATPAPRPTYRQPTRYRAADRDVPTRRYRSYRRTYHRSDGVSGIDWSQNMRY